MWKSIIITLFLISNNTVFSVALEIVESDPVKDLNIVIFFTHVDTQCTSLQKNALKYLHLHEATRVKHAAEREAANVEEEHKSGSEFCKELLKDSLMSLTHYCHTVRRMKTAVASVSSKEMTNDIQEPETQFHTPRIDIVDKKNRFSRSDNYMPDQPSGKPIEESNGESSRAAGNNFITGAKHTEVFQIRVRRSPAKDEAKKENLAESSGIKRNIIKPAAWDVLDVMKHVRYSFLGSIFDEASKIEDDQEDVIDIRQLGKEKQDTGLFSMVKTTLGTLLDSPEASFLMVIFGGHLRSVADRHSPLVQSIKYVLENTDPEKTLLVVTGSCAEDSNQLRNLKEDYTMPVYAKGPNCNILAECKLLYDIPLIIRKILEVHSGSGIYNL